jgi:hypothetical protein
MRVHGRPEERLLIVGESAFDLNFFLAEQGLAQPFLILILEGAPLLSRLLRQGGDFDLRALRVPGADDHPTRCTFVI